MQLFKLFKPLIQACIVQNTRLLFVLILFLASGFLYQDLFVVSGTPLQRNGYEVIQASLKAIETGDHRWDFAGDIRKPGFVESLLMPAIKEKFNTKWNRSLIAKAPHDTNFYHGGFDRFVSKTPSSYSNPIFQSFVEKITPCIKMVL